MLQKEIKHIENGEIDHIVKNSAIKKRNFQQVQDCYDKMITHDESISDLPIDLRQTLAKEYSLFQDILAEHQMNIEVKLQVNEILAGIFTKQITDEVLQDMGYDKNGILGVSEKLTANIPPLTVSNKL